jgi:hypothetical protein
MTSTAGSTKSVAAITAPTWQPGPFSGALVTMQISASTFGWISSACLMSRRPAGHVVGDEAEHGHFDAHLLHLGEGGEAALEAGDLVAAGFLAAADLVLDGVGVVPVHVRVLVGDLGDVVGLQFGGFEVLGEPRMVGLSSSMVPALNQMKRTDVPPRPPTLQTGCRRP